MRSHFIISFFVLAFLFLSCKDSLLTVEKNDPEGMYAGKYIVTAHAYTDSSVTDTCNVTISFFNKEFNVVSYDTGALLNGAGKYKTGKFLTLTDTLARVAIYDDRVILTGDFKYELKEDRLVMSQYQKRFNRFRMLDLNSDRDTE